MAEATQYAFELKEIGELLVKNKEIHSGLWDVSFDLSLAAGVMGAASESAVPSALIQIMRATLTKHPEGQPANAATVDAAEVNPHVKSKKSGTKSPKIAE
jgi:hypothetical protein